jgi:hypothetical protein
LARTEETSGMDLIQTFAENKPVETFQPDTLNTKNVTETLPANESIFIPEYFDQNLIDFNITTLVTYCHVSQFTQHEALKAFIGAWKNEQTFVEKQNTLTELRNRYNASVVEDEKNTIANQIIDLETELFAMKAETDGLFQKARTLEQTEWDNATASVKRDIGQQCDSIRNHFQQLKQHKEDSIRAREIQANEAKTDTLTTPEVFPDETTKTSVNESTKPDANKVLYKVQIGRSAPAAVAKTEQQFKNISKIRRIDRYTDQQGMIAFTVGELTNLNDAVQLQKQIRMEGIKDAFVIAFQNGKRITLNEAKAILQP